MEIFYFGDEANSVEGCYTKAHVDKEEFLTTVLQHLKDYCGYEADETKDYMFELVEQGYWDIIEDKDGLTMVNVSTDHPNAIPVTFIEIRF